MEDKGYVWKKQKIVHHANKKMNKTLIVHILIIDSNLKLIFLSGIKFTATGFKKFSCWAHIWNTILNICDRAFIF